MKQRSTKALSRILVAVFSLQQLLIAVPVARADISDGMNAFDVLGQGGNFTTSTGATSATGLRSPSAVAVDTVNHRLFATNNWDPYILIYNLDINNVLIDRTADFALNAPDPSGPDYVTGYYFDNVDAMAYDPTGNRLFVADSSPSQNRVLVYDVASITNGEAPVNVLGQPDLSTFTFPSSTTASNMRPRGLAFDDARDLLFVSDPNFSSGGGNRVLVFNVASITNGEPAVNVLGQPNFTSNGANTQNAGAGCTTSVNACGMNQPGALAYDPTNQRLFLNDENNSRVLTFNVASITDHEAAVSVLGQTTLTDGSFHSASQSQFGSLSGLTYDNAHQRLFLSSGGDNRTLMFDVAAITNGENAVNVIGQTNFTNTGAATTQSGQSGPDEIVYGSNDVLYVVDSTNNRVLLYDAADTTAPAISNVAAINIAADSVTITWTTTEPSDISKVEYGLTASYGQAVLNDDDLFTSHSFDIFGLSDSTLYHFRACSTDVSGNEGCSGDFTFTTGVSTITDGMNASQVIGQSNFTSNTPDNAPTQNGLSSAFGSTLDAANHRYYLSDFSNDRILVYNLTVGNVLADTTPDFVLGQPDFTTGTSNTQNVGNGCTTTPNACGLNSPMGLAIDTAGNRLFAVDAGNGRVLIFDVASITNGEAAVSVIGKPNFTTVHSGSVTQSTFFSPGWVAYDPTGQRIFVNDSGGVHRVMVFDVASITNGENAINVIGNTNFTGGGGTLQNGFASTGGVAFDDAGNRLFATDGGRSRIMVFDVASITDGENAVNVLGQPDFTTTSVATTQAKLRFPVSTTFEGGHNRLFVADTGNKRVIVYDVASITNGENAISVLGVNNFTTIGSGAATQSTMTSEGVSYDPTNDRLYATDDPNHRVLVFHFGASGDTTAPVVSSVASGSITSNSATITWTTDESSDSKVNYGLTAGYGSNTTNASMVTSHTINLTGLSPSTLYHYQACSKDAALNEACSGDFTFTTTAGGSSDPTLSNRVVLSRIKAGVSATVDIHFTLQNTLSGPLTVTFPAGFTVTAAATGGSACLSGFGFTASTLTATKTNCSGAISMTGATVTNPGSTGIYTITWVNDDPGSASVFIISEDQVNVSAAVDPVLTFNVGAQASATACAGSFAGNGGTVALGSLTTASVASSDASSVSHICTRLTTNAANGATVSVRSLNASLASTSVPADTIPSSTATLAAGTAGYGLCAGSAGADSGFDVTAPVGAAPTRSAPYNGSCTSSAHDVGALTTGPQNLWTVADATQNAFVRLYIKAAISPSTPAHNDYTDTLTFVATGTF